MNIDDMISSWGFSFQLIFLNLIKHYLFEYFRHTGLVKNSNYLIVIYACRKHCRGPFNKERNQMILNHSLSQFSLRRCLQKGRNRDGLCLRSWTAGNYQRKLLRQNRTISLSEYHHLSSTYIVITVNNLYVGQSSKYDHLSFPSITKDYFFWTNFRYQLQHNAIYKSWMT